MEFEQKALITLTWMSALFFGLYILSFYIGAAAFGNLKQWNQVLPGLYQEANSAATVGIGIHFVTGSLLLSLGSIQFINIVRVRFPLFHKIMGRIYVLASIATAVGGLVFIVINGTIGGLMMDVGFALYGVLLLVSAIQTIRKAKDRDFKSHQLWAMRLYALAIASWLYRMEYGMWFAFFERAGHTENFTGYFDQVMSFFFYIPNLIVVQHLTRSRGDDPSRLSVALSIVILGVAILVVVFGTYFFFRYYWGPAILALF